MFYIYVCTHKYARICIYVYTYIYMYIYIIYIGIQMHFKLYECKYHQQQNKWYPSKGVYLPISKLHSILAVANLLGHNNITISYYV